MSRLRLVWMVLAVAACGPTKLTAEVIDRDDYVSACVRVRACVTSTTGVPSATQCAALGATAEARAPFSSAGRCIDGAAGDCDAIFACLAAPAAPAACSIDDVPSCLDGTHVLRCLGGARYVEACGEGLACVPADQASGQAGCGRQACGETYVPSCDGDELLRCESGVLVARPCPEGARCTPGATADAEATCVGEGDACSAPRCDGTRLDACEGGHVATRDCAADGVDGTCALPAGGDASCVGAGGECDAAFADRCNGARLEYCRDGHIVGLDCTSLGFAACDVASSRCAAAAGGGT